MAFLNTTTAKWALLSVCLVLGFHIGGTAGDVIGLIEAPATTEASGAPEAERLAALRD